VRVRSVAAAEGGLLAELEVAADAGVGEREVTLGGVSSGGSVAVYRTVDGLEVLPQAGLARIGGARFEKGFQQFEARASSAGADGRSGTADDFDLGPVEVSWSLEEFAATVFDDDAGFVGRIDANGLFTPAEDGPNPRRRGSRNNVGDVWVVASLPADSPIAPAKPLRARAHLVVTVPLYVRWDQPEVSP
jgi:quinohemoprotein amine dehydrogenase